MLVMSRSVGEALVFGAEWSLTLTHVDIAVAEVNMASLWDPGQVSTIPLPLNQLVEVLPDVLVVFQKPLADGAGARLGLEVPRELPVHRKEVFDAFRQT